MLKYQVKKIWAVGCRRGNLSGSRYRFAYGPADATATHCLLLQCVCVLCVCVCSNVSSSTQAELQTSMEQSSTVKTKFTKLLGVSILSLQKMPPYYFLNYSVKNEPILIIFGTYNRGEIWHKWLCICPPPLQKCHQSPHYLFEIQKSGCLSKHLAIML